MRECVSFKLLTSHEGKSVDGGVFVRSAWLIELAKLPSLDSSTQLIGFDINPKFFPPAAWIPSTITLLQYDLLATDSIPDDLVGTFDVVNARLIGTLFNNGDPQYFLQTVSRLLRSGGRFQWIDIRSLGGSGKAMSASSNEMVHAKKMIELGRTQNINRDMLPMFVRLAYAVPADESVIADRAFENWQEKYGLEIQLDDERKVPSELWKPWTESTMQIWQRLGPRLPTASEKKPGVTREEFAPVFEGAMKEVEQGGAVIIEKFFELHARKL